MSPRLLLAIVLWPASGVASAQHESHSGHAHASRAAASPASSAPASDTALTAPEPPPETPAPVGPPPSLQAHALPAAPGAFPAPLPPPTAAERAAAFPELHGMRMQDHMDDDPVLAALAFDRLEWQDAGAGDAAAWELQGWIGDLENRLWLRSEGARHHGRLDHGDVEVLWGRPTGPWWDRLIGVRHDLGHGGRDWLAIGVQGLAPYKFEIAVTGYLGSDGHATLRAEAEYELLLSNRWILQPRIEANAYTRDDRTAGTGRGLSDASAGLRLRYEVTRQFAPYVGYEWSRRFGRSADFAEAAGEAPFDHAWVAGIRFWF